MFKQKQFMLMILFIVSMINIKAQDVNFETKFISTDNTRSLILFNEQPNYKANDVLHFINKEFRLGSDAELKTLHTRTDKLNFTHITYQLYYKGIKVEHGICKAHLKEDKLISISGEFYEIDLKDQKTSLSETEALDILLRTLGKNAHVQQSKQHDPVHNSSDNLVIIPIRNDDQEIISYSLVYKFDILITDPMDGSYYFVDANTGAIVAKEQRLCNSDAETMYSGSVNIVTTPTVGGFRLLDPIGNGIHVRNNNNVPFPNTSNATDFIDEDDNWTAAEWDNPQQDQIALDALWGIEQTYYYFLAFHNWNSFDNQSGLVNAYVHVGNALNNAFYYNNELYFGDGNGQVFTPLASLDVCAHEFGHGVDEYSSNLVYQNESGALDEGLADIWGACVEGIYAPEKSMWLIAEEVTVFQYALRDMSNPNALDNPDTYMGNFWATGPGDQGGVHTNSGVLGHWFYLLTEGSADTDQINDNGDEFEVNGIGLEDAAEIAFRMETVYLSPNSTYAEAREYGIQAAIDLFGPCSPQRFATQNAFYAVGLGEEIPETVIAEFHFEDVQQNPTDEFCNNDLVFLNCNPFQQNAEYNLAVSRAPLGTENFVGIANISGEGEINTVNFSQLMIDNVTPLEGGFHYEVELIVLPECAPFDIWVERFTMLNCCDTPTNLSCTSINGNTFLTWTSPPGATGFNIFIDPTSACCGNDDEISPAGFFWPINQYSLKNVSASCFQWQVQAICDNNEVSALSEPDCFNQLTPCWGERPSARGKESHQKSKFQSTISPNPNNGHTLIELQIPEPTNVHIEVYNMDGRLIKNFAEESVEPGLYQKEWFADSNLSNGIYFIQINTNLGSFQERVLIIR